MENIPNNKRKYKISKADNYKYISIKDEKPVEFDLINERIYDYKIDNESNIKGNKGFQNGSRRDKYYISNNNEYTSNYPKYKNNRQSNFGNTLNSYYFDINNNNYNNDEYNNGGNFYQTHLIRNKDNNSNCHIYGNLGNNTIKYSNCSNNSQSKKDPKKYSNIARTFKYINNKGTYINHVYEENSINSKNYKSNQNNVKIEISSDKIKNNNLDYKPINYVRNFDISTTNKTSLMTKEGTAEDKKKLCSNKIQDNLNLKMDLKYKYLEEESKSKTPLKMNQRYYKNNIKSTTYDRNIDNNNRINGGENNKITYFSPESRNDIGKNKRGSKEQGTSSNSNKFNRRDNKELNKQESLDRNNKNNYNNNLRKYNEGDNNSRYINRRNQNSDKFDTINKEKNEAKNYKESNFINKTSQNTKSTPDILKDIKHKNINYNNVKTPKPNNNKQNHSIFSGSGKTQKVRNRTSDNNHSSKEGSNNFDNIVVITSSNKRNNRINIPKINIDLEKYNRKKDKDIKIDNAGKNSSNSYIQKNIKENSNQETNNKINDKLKEKIKQLKNQNSIKSNNLNNNNNIVRINGIENNNNSTNRNNNRIIILNKQNTDKIIFQKKVNRSPVGFKKKINTNIPNNKIDTSQNTKVKNINPPYLDISSNNLKSIVKEKNNIKTEINICEYKTSCNFNSILPKDIEKNKFKDEENINLIDNFKNSNPQNCQNGNIYIRQKPKKKIIQKKITKGKIESKVNNEMKEKEKKNNNILFSNSNIKEIKNKVVIANKRVSKYYDFFINYPKIRRCYINKKYFKSIKIPKLEVCKISKINSVIYILYKNKSVCHYTKTREIIKKLTKPPLNEICECSKNIILIPPILKKKKKEEEKKDQIENKPQVVAPKKTKKRKKRRKTRRIHNGKETNPNINKNNNSNNKEDNATEDNLTDEKNEDEINDNNLKTNKEEINEEIQKEEKEEKKEEKKEENEEIISYNDNIENLDKINIAKEGEKISLINSNSIFNLNNILDNKQNNSNIQNLVNDKSSILKSLNEEKGVFSDKEILIGDIDKSGSIRKKISTGSYNYEENNDEENDDFRIVSDDDISDDKLKKKQFVKEIKTEGKEIIGDFDINKNKNADQNKVKDYENKTRALESILEKLQGKRNSHLFFMKNENEQYENIDNVNNSNNAIDEGNKNKKNIEMGTNKLNEIFNNFRYNNDNNIYSQENQEESENEVENENENEDIYIDRYNNFSDEENRTGEEKEEIKNETNNDNIFGRKNNTFKKNVDYEKIGSIFDKLEGIFDKKKSNNFIDNNSNDNIKNEKSKTPLLKKGISKQRISDFNLRKANDFYNSNYKEYESNNYTSDNLENEINNCNENDNNNAEIIEDYSEDKKAFINMDKYKDIFNNKQQIISKLEILMNKPKNKTNEDDNNINNYIFNSPKIENEIDSDMNINKDTPGNRKEIKKNNFFNRNSIKKNKYSIEEIFSYKNKLICLNTNLLPFKVINHCNEIMSAIQENYSSFKKNYKDIIIDKNNNYNIYNNIARSRTFKSDQELTMAKWARKDMSKEIEIAEKYIKELNTKMSKDNYKYEIIEILNTLTVDNYKNILKKMIEMIFLTENSNNNKIELNKPEYLLHNQFIFVEIILDKATIEKGYVVLYAKLCADLFIELIKLIKEYNNPEIENQLIKGENLKTILTSECRQRFDECISISTLSKKMEENEKNEVFLIFKKKFLGNMNFIAELINVKLLSQTKGFEFLDILYKRYSEIKNNDKIKFLNLEGAVTLLTKFGKIVMERQNPKHIQNLDNYMKDCIMPIVSVNKSENKNLPNYLKFKIINLIEKKKNNWKDSLYEQSIIAKGKNNNINNISLYHDGGDSNINIDESLIDCQKGINNNISIQDKEDGIIILLKNDIENYTSFLNEHNIFNKKDLNEYYIKNENSDINNEYDWSISEELIIKTKNELEEIIRCYIEVCIDYVTKENNIFYCNEYIKNIINYYSVDLSKDEIEKVNSSMNELYLNIEDICIDNYYMLEIMGYLMQILLNNNLFYIEDFEKFRNEDKNKIIKISQVIKFAIVHSNEKSKEIYNKFEKIKLFNDNKAIFEENILKPLKNDYNMNLD